MKGLYGKYIVRKRSDNSIVTNCFVLRPDRDDAAIAAMLAYANATDDELLAQELREWAEYEQGVKPPVTNADCIRAMADEELAEQLVINVYGLSEKTLYLVPPTGKVYARRDIAEAHVLAWLQQPYKEHET